MSIYNEDGTLTPQGVTYQIAAEAISQEAIGALNSYVKNEGMTALESQQFYDIFIAQFDIPKVFLLTQLQYQAWVAAGGQDG